MKYICGKCGQGFSAANRPNICPFCGFEQLKPDSKSRRTADKLLEEVSEDIPVLDKLWSEYVTLLAEYEYKMLSLRQYKHRGIIEADEIPERKQETLAAALKRYRAEKKKGASK